MANICSRFLLRAAARWCRNLQRPKAVLNLVLVLMLLGWTCYYWHSAGRATKAMASHHSGWHEGISAYFQRHPPGDWELQPSQNQQSSEQGGAKVAPASHRTAETSELETDPKDKGDKKGEVAQGRSDTVVDVLQGSHLWLSLNANAGGWIGPGAGQNGALNMVPGSDVQSQSASQKAKEEETPGSKGYASWTQQTMVRAVDGAFVIGLASTTAAATKYSAEALANRTAVCEEIPFGCPGQELLAPFKPALNKEELCLLLTLMQALTQALNQAGISYFLYGGTLIGSWRHHGVVPWDDDIDVAVDFRQVEDLPKVLQDLSPTFRLVARSDQVWKFSAERGEQLDYRGASWTWPFIDICFYDQNATHVADHYLKTYPGYVFPREWVLPFVLRPFHGLLLPAPRRTGLVLRHSYNVSQCDLGVYSHRLDRGRPRDQLRSLDCRQLLQHCYPGVERRQVRVHVGEGVGTSPTVLCNETTVLRGVVLSWEIVDDIDEC